MISIDKHCIGHWSARFRVSASAMLVALVASCGTSAPTRDQPMLQGFDLINGGRSDVRDVEIRYGDYVFPPGGESSVVRVQKIKGLGFHQGATVSVPESAAIHWVSSDGQSHDALVPIRKWITHWDEFHGFQFIFVDDHVDVAVTYVRRPPEPYGSYSVISYTSGRPAAPATN
jgi:hypothetical protein